MPTRSKPAIVAPRKQPQQARAKQTVADIMQAATYILARRGYAAMTTNAVAERAGVNVASVYQYFPNKQAILVELMRRHAAESRAVALAAFEAEGKGKGSALRRMVAATVAAHSVQPELHRIFTEEGARLGLPPFESDSDAALAAAGRAWIATAKRRKNPELALWVAGVAAHSVVHAAFVMRPDIAKSPELVDEITLLLSRYLGSPSQRARP